MTDKAIQFKPRLTSSQLARCLVHMVRDPDTFAFARDRLKASDFGMGPDLLYGVLWAAVLAVAAQNGGTLPQEGTELCIGTELISKRERAAATGEVSPQVFDQAEQLLIWIFDTPEETLNPAFYRATIKDLIIEKKIIRSELPNLVMQARDVGRRPDLPEALEQFASQIRQIESLRSEAPGNLRDEWPAFQDRLQMYRGREFLGLPTGLARLDQSTLGLRGLVILGAMPNVGKTALVLHLGVNVVRNNPDACFLFISLEMDRASLFTRIYCNLAEMDWGTLVRGDKDLRGGGSGTFFNPDQVTRLEAAERWIRENGHRIRILDRKSFGDVVTAATIVREMKSLKGQSGASRALVVIDYLQVIPVPANTLRGGELEADKYQVRVAQDVLAEIQQSEISLVGDAVVAISETRKPATGRRHWGEDLADLMGSARLGYGADAVLLYRRADEDEIDDAYGAFEGRTPPTIGQLESQGIAPIMLRLAKGRDGMRLGEWPMEYHFNRSIFRELERDRGVQLPSGRRAPAPPRVMRPDPFDQLGAYDA